MVAPILAAAAARLGPALAAGGSGSAAGAGMTAGRAASAGSQLSSLGLNLSQLTGKTGGGPPSWSQTLSQFIQAAKGGGGGGSGGGGGVVPPSSGSGGSGQLGQIISILRESVNYSALIHDQIKYGAGGSGGGGGGGTNKNAGVGNQGPDWRGMWRGITNAFGTERAGGVLAGLGGTLSASNIPGLSQVGRFAQVLGESVEKLRRWNDQLLQGNLRLAEFSGAMAVVAAEQRIADVRLGRQRGDRRASIAREQARSRQELEKTLAPVEDAWAAIQGRVSSLLNRELTNVLKMLKLDVLAEEILKWLGIQTKPGDDPIGADAWWELVRNNDWWKNHGKPKRF